MQAQCSHAVLFCLVTSSCYDSCCSYFSLFSVSWAVSSFHEAEFMSGEGHIQFNVYGPGPFNEGRPRAGGLSALPGSAQVMFLVFSLEAHGGRKGIASRHTCHHDVFLPSFPPCLFYFPSPPILLSSPPPVLCEHDVNSERSDYLSF
jgi:hypothetical protein